MGMTSGGGSGGGGAQDVVNLSREMGGLTWNTYDISYDANGLPSASGFTANVSGDTEVGYTLVDGGTLAVNTTGVSTGTCYWNYTGISVAFASKFIYEIRGRVISSCTGAPTDQRCNFLTLRDGASSIELRMATDTVRMYGDTNVDITIDTTVMRTYHLVVSDRSAVLYIDGVYAGACKTKTDASADTLWFGDATSAAGATSNFVIDYIRWDNGTTAAIEGGQTATQVNVTADNMFIGNNETSAIDLTLDTGNSAGAEGIDTGTWAVDTTYVLWLLYGDSGTTIVASLAEDFASVTKPSGYDTAGRIIGHVRTDSTTATDLLYGYWSGNVFSLATPFVVSNTGSSPTNYTEVDFSDYFKTGMTAGIMAVAVQSAASGALFSYDGVTPFAGCSEYVYSPIRFIDAGGWYVLYKTGAAASIVIRLAGWEDAIA